MIDSVKCLGKVQETDSEIMRVDVDFMSDVLEQPGDNKVLQNF